MTCAAPTTYTKCDTKSAVRNWPAVPGGICIGMYFRNGFSPKTTKIRPSKIRAINTAIFIFGSSPNQSIHEGAGTLRAPAPHSMSNERLLWKFVLEPICPRSAFTRHWAGHNTNGKCHPSHKRTNVSKFRLAQRLERTAHLLQRSAGSGGMFAPGPPGPG